MEDKKGRFKQADAGVEQTDAPQSTANPELEKGRVKNYIVPEGEEGSVHAEIEQVQFEQSTGRKKSVPTVQKFDPRAWDNFRVNAAGLGYNYVRVLHAPKGVNTDVPKVQNR